MTTETKPRTLEDVLANIPTSWSAVAAWDARELIREAFALGAASRASPEEGRLRALILAWVRAVDAAAQVASKERVKAEGRAALALINEVDPLRSPPAPSEEARCSACGTTDYTPRAMLGTTLCHACAAADAMDAAAPPPEDSGARERPCGCVLCICEDEERCHGCGATTCKTHQRAPASSKEGGR